MAITYTTLGSTVTITPTGVVPAAQLNTDVAIVGGYDAANAASDVTAGESTTVSSTVQAQNQFGENSELARQARLAALNGAGDIHGVPVPETQTTETFGSSTASSSGTLSNVPVFDPRVHPDHEITVEDVTDGQSVTVNEVYGTPSGPTDSNTININPRTGEWEADAASEYDITYTYGDYDTAIESAVDDVVRAVIVCSEATSVKAKLNSELGAAESNFRFLRGVAGAEPDIQPSEVNSYTPSEEDWRLIETASARGTSTDGGVRTAGAIGGMIASQPVDVSGSITYDNVAGLQSLNVAYSPTEASNFEQVTAITDEFEVAEGVTTSTETSFRDIYKVEIIDFVVENVYSRLKDFKGGSNAQTSRRLFASRVRRLLSSYAVPNAQPPLLASGDGSQPYYVSQSLGNSDTETDLTVGIDVAPIAKTVNLDLSVGPIEFNGATATQ